MLNKKMQIILAVACLVFTAGCAKEKSKGQHVLAKINNYELTVQDFNDEISLTRGNKNLSADPLKAREQLLQEIINKKILILQAQKLNFDKDKAFMKEIERYWEQALLKLLLKRKSEELIGIINVSDKEVQQEYQRMREEDSSIGSFQNLAPQLREELLDRKRMEALEAWIDGLRKNAKVEINEDILEEVR